MSVQPAQTVAQPRTKAITKQSTKSGVRLWVRAKFLGFRRYFTSHSDPKSNKMLIKLF